MKPILAFQSGGLTEVQHAVRDHFQEGGSMTAILLVLLAVAGTVFAAYYFTKRLRKADETARSADPRKLFADLLHRLNLTPSQRQWLASLARDLRLTQPTVILLSPALFNHYVDAWQRGHSTHAAPTDESPNTQAIARIREVLFPGGYPRNPFDWPTR